MGATKKKISKNNNHLVGSAAAAATFAAVVSAAHNILLWKKQQLTGGDDGCRKIDSFGNDTSTASGDSVCDNKQYIFVKKPTEATIIGGDDGCSDSSGFGDGACCDSKRYLLAIEATKATISRQHRQLKQRWFSDGTVRGKGNCDNNRYISLFLKSNNQLAATMVLYKQHHLDDGASTASSDCDIEHYNLVREQQSTGRQHWLGIWNSSRFSNRAGSGEGNYDCNNDQYLLKMSNNQLAATIVVETAAALVMAPPREQWLQINNMFCSKKQYTAASDRCRNSSVFGGGQCSEWWKNH